MTPDPSNDVPDENDLGQVVTIGDPLAERAWRGRQTELPPGEVPDPASDLATVVTMNVDPVGHHTWEWKPPGPLAEKYRKFIKRRPPEQ